MKRTFPCGHKGQGKYCHRCKHADELARVVEPSRPGNEALKSEVERLRALSNAPAPLA